MNYENIQKLGLMIIYTHKEVKMYEIIFKRNDKTFKSIF